jgi:putative lipoic acid-binding regulatory protein
MVDLEKLMDFPCSYTIKVLGLASDEFTVLVVEVVSRHAPESVGEPDVRASSKGSFTSVNLTFTVGEPAQLYAIHEELNQSSMVRMIL